MYWVLNTCLCSQLCRTEEQRHYLSHIVMTPDSEPVVFPPLYPAVPTQKYAHVSLTVVFLLPFFLWMNPEDYSCLLCSTHYCDPTIPKCAKVCLPHLFCAYLTLFACAASLECLLSGSVYSVPYQNAMSLLFNLYQQSLLFHHSISSLLKGGGPMFDVFSVFAASSVVV